ncbi:MAG: acyl-CoA dehydrogenase family protein [Planctomycetota bacterium]|nr:acyl-CoA dehydrogenase family protein [Planctomycetota bacterium]
MSELGKLLDDVIGLSERIIGPGVVHLDQTAEFPKQAGRELGSLGVLGLLSAKDVGGMGLKAPAAVRVVEAIAQRCGSTAMILSMHYCSVLAIEAFANEDIRKKHASGERLGTLAFSEFGSRSNFWAPVSTATPGPNGFSLNAEKSWVTSANHADDYVWSSKPHSAAGPMTLWLVPADSAGLSVGPAFDGLGLRGNDSTSISAKDVAVGEDAQLGEDGKGLDFGLGVITPHFNLLSAACSLGLMEAAVERAIKQATSARLTHLNSRLCDLPTIRAYLAKARIKTDMVRSLVYDAADALATGREDTLLRVLEAKAAAGEMSLEVIDLGMRVCGGAAFRKEFGLERIFRDARAASVMAPTTDALYDFIGRALCGMELFS